MGRCGYDETQELRCRHNDRQSAEFTEVTRPCLILDLGDQCLETVQPMISRLI